MTGLMLLAVLGAGDFAVVSETDGIVLEARPVPGSAWLEYRVTTIVSGDARALCDRAFGTGAMDPGEPHLTARTVLLEKPDERVTWDEIAPPMVSHRDYVVRRTRVRAPGGECRVDFHADASLAPPPRPGWVRIEILHGAFVFTPLPGGKVRVEHTVHMEPGGLIAPFVAEPARREMAVAWVRRLAAPETPRARR
ncbi:MAG: START domain-containing protein [Myxococcota bacterium]